MKKVIVLTICICMALTIVGCNGKTVTKDGTIDIDLTSLSSTMVYSKVYDMVNEPEKDMGKTVKMEGKCTKYVDEDTKKVYYTCLIQDATQCCAQGIEFELKDKKYPSEREDIVVVGKLDAYREDGTTYCVLRNAKLVKDKSNNETTRDLG